MQPLGRQQTLSRAGSQHHQSSMRRGLESRAPRGELDAKAEALRQARVRATEANARCQNVRRLAELRAERAELAKQREEKQ